MKLKMKNPGDVVIICQKTGFKERTVYNWLAKLNQDPNFNLIAKQKKKKFRYSPKNKKTKLPYIFWKAKCPKENASLMQIVWRFWLSSI